MTGNPPSSSTGTTTTTSNSTNDLHDQISTALLQKYSLPVSPAWLGRHVPRSGPNPTPPLASLTQTALFRLLGSDITVSLSPVSTDNTTSTNSHQHNHNNSSSGGGGGGGGGGSTSDARNKFIFPPGISDRDVKEQRLKSDVPTQLLAIEDVGASRWSQVEAIERVERGEAVRGREIVRSVDVDDAGARRGNGGGCPGGAGAGSIPATAATAAATSANTGGGGGGGGPHKYILQDAAGTRMVAFEKERIEKLGLRDKECFIGMKLVLKRGTVLRRGLLMLGRGDVAVLGGKVEAWDEAWRKGRKQGLLDAITTNHP